MIKFKKKDFSILSDMIDGATLGGSLGAFGGLWANPNKNIDFKSGSMFAGIGMLAGAALGAAVGGIKELIKHRNAKKTVDARLIKDIIELLKKDGMKSGKDYTLDPKMANILKTKVCVVLSKVSGDLRIAVNLIKDDKLKRVSENAIKNIPNISVANKNISDRYNDITITSMEGDRTNIGLVVSIIEYFIHSGYPVYLVEVG